jgi:hypothetical protein
LTQSVEYKKLLQEMHEANPKWGKEFKKDPIPAMLQNAIAKYKPKSILDFGTGKGFLTKKLKLQYPDIDVIGWDPIFDEPLPEKVDMVVSTDVLEHVEPQELENTLLDLKSRTKICQYHIIACFPAVSILPDGRNAHLIIENPQWWKEKLKILEMRTVIDKVIRYTKPKKNKKSLKIVKYECILEL